MGREASAANPQPAGREKQARRCCVHRPGAQTVPSRLAPGPRSPRANLQKKTRQPQGPPSPPPPTWLAVVMPSARVLHACSRSPSALPIHTCCRRLQSVPIRTAHPPTSLGHRRWPAFTCPARDRQSQLLLSPAATMTTSTATTIFCPVPCHVYCPAQLQHHYYSGTLPSAALCCSAAQVPQKSV
jgi:hypothetical protein